MRRIWLGVGVLLILLAVGVLVMQVTGWQLEKIAETLEQASKTENWGQAVSLAQKAQRDWETKWHLLAALADHKDLDTIDGLFAQLEVYGKQGSKTDHAAICAQLSEAICDLEESHSFSWWNLLSFSCPV